VSYRDAIADYVRSQARPVDKYGHQPRLYALTIEVGWGRSYDEDVVYAAAWLHDLGVFIGHRPEDKEALARWDHIAYTVERVPAILRECNFPEEKIPAVLAAIQTHQPAESPATIEAVILRDADILEQLGAVGILRNVSKVGRDTRYATFRSVVDVLRRNLAELPGRLQLETARELAAPRIEVLRAFLDAVAEEAGSDLD
jgi:uncharacterized protein